MESHIRIERSNLMFSFFKKKEKTYFVTWIHNDQSAMKMTIGARTIISAKQGMALADECISGVHHFVPDATIISIQPLN